MSKEKTLSSQLIYDGKILQLYRDDVELEDGKTSKREYVRHSGGACVLAVDDEENIFLVSQFRYPYGAETIEIPAGKREKGEDPFVCAVRELEEETGLVAEKYELMASVILYLYLATGLTKKTAHLDEGEFLGVIKVPFEKAYQMALSGEIHDSKTLVAIYAYAAKKARKEL